MRQSTWGVQLVRKIILVRKIGVVKSSPPYDARIAPEKYGRVVRSFRTQSFKKIGAELHLILHHQKFL